MPGSAHSLPHDPLDYKFPAAVSGTQAPVPLVGTSFSVTIDAGLALVTTMRRFRNVEPSSIEVTMTFPVPVHATLFDLIARVGERRLQARAEPRMRARETYEDSIDQGRTAVLHEEVLRGVHQLSVAHVPPGSEITVEASWILPLSAIPGGGSLHIPVTVGDVYGHSPLQDSDDLFHSSDVRDADLSVDCRDGVVALVGGVLSDGAARVRLNKPIRLIVTGWQPRMLLGIAADGRGVSVEINPAPTGRLPLDAAILIDRSGSMNEAATTMLLTRLETGRVRTKHEVLTAGLMEAATDITPADRIDLWEFNSKAEQVPGANFADSVRLLSPPIGGTATGEAIRSVLAARPVRDVLLVTDGKSYALDVQAAARSGQRFNVVLIGEDSLEALVGHLAALTGGQIFISAGLESGSIIQKAIDAMRLPHATASPIPDVPTSVEAVLGGMEIRAVWSAQAETHPSQWSRAVAAIAAALAIPRMSQERAEALAVAEGIVCHLTSLVLLDEIGDAQEGLPAQRRVGLSAPATTEIVLARLRDGAPDASSSAQHFLSMDFECLESISAAAPDESRSSEPREISSLHDRPAFMRRQERDQGLLRHLGCVDWTTDPEALRRGDLYMLPAEVKEAICKAAERQEVISLAATLGAQPIVVVLALLADAESASNRAAKRFARAVLGRSAGSFVARLGFGREVAKAMTTAAKAIGL